MTKLLLWIRQHKSSAAGIVLVVAGCVALVQLSRKVHHLAPRRPAAAVAAAAPGGTTSIAPASAATAGTEQGGRSTRLRSEFENATSDVEFIARAIGRPLEGGKFYAMLAWKRCDQLAQHAGVAATHAGSQAFVERAMARVQAMGRRCAGVPATYPDAMALYKVATEQRGGRDALMPENGRGLVAPASRQTANADIDAALRTGDRWAAAEALRDNADFLDVGNSTGDDGVDRQLREWAAETVACELVGSCRGGVEVSLHCVGSGDCVHDDLRDVIVAKVPEAQRIIFDTMLAGLHERMGLVPGRIDR